MSAPPPGFARSSSTWRARSSRIGSLIPGAAAALAEAAARGIGVAFVTNTTSRPRSVLVRELAEMGLPVDTEAVFSAPRAAREYLLRTGRRRCLLLARPSLLEDLAGIEASESPTDADAVVLGDLGDALTYERLNRAFRALVAGAELVALARNRYWRAKDGLDARRRRVRRRPRVRVGQGRHPGRQALAGVLRRGAEVARGARRREAAVIGDDLESDVAGAQAAGLRGILVRTGKYRPEELERSPIRPDAVLGSIAELSGLL